jgi:hypothetical protein
MTLFLKITAAVALIYGLVGVIFPSFLLANYGLLPEAAVVLMARFFGATLIAWGIGVWLVADSGERAACRGILGAAIVGDAVGFVVALAGTIGGTMNTMGWSAVLIYGVLFLGSLYFLLNAGRSVRSVP